MKVHKRGPAIMDLTGKHFGDWTVVDLDIKKGSNWYWLCQCSCGNIQSVNGSKLNTGQSTKCKSCRGKENGRIGLYAMSANDHVYFIRCGEFVKIGASKDPKRRLKDMESNNPYELELLIIDEDEEFWHNIFAHRKHKGEWYYFPRGSM